MFELLFMQAACDMVKHESRVTSCELQAKSLKARVESLKSTS